VHIEQMNVFR